MLKAFIIAVSLSIAGASAILAQAPDVLPASPYSPSGKRSIESSEQEESEARPEAANSAPTSGAEKDQGKSDREDGPAGGKVSGPPGRFWVSGEYLLWWLKDARLPPLVTTGPANPALLPPPGALGANGTAVLFGGREVDQDPLSGMRLTAGFWLNHCQTFGVEASAFALPSNSSTFATGSPNSSGTSVLARPFFDVSTGLVNSELFSFPGLANGSISVQSTSRLEGAGANFVGNLCCNYADCCDGCKPSGGYRVDLIAGLRYLDLKEGLGITENTQVLPNSPVLSGSTIRAIDQFDTRNQFYGVEIGARAWWERNRIFASATGTVALGTTHESVDINGATSITPPGGPRRLLPGSFLAQPSNCGHFSRDPFSVVPELSLNVGYRLTNNLNAFAGYNFLYWSNVVRPGDQINLAVNSTRTPVSLVPPAGPAAPLFNFRGSDFWAQGISVGVQLRF